METLFRKVLVSERLPNQGKYVFCYNGKGRTDVGELSMNGRDLIFNNRGRRLVNQTKWWLEEIQLPSEEEMKKEAESYTLSQGENKKHFIGGFHICYNYILGFIDNKK